MHYKDGTEARVGDQVAGKLYNTEGTRIGVIVSVTPGTESCNAMVTFHETVPIDDQQMAAHTAAPWEPGDPILALVPRMAVWRTRDGYERESLGAAAGNRPVCRFVRGLMHGNDGPMSCVFECQDYTEIKALTPIDRNQVVFRATTGERVVVGPRMSRSLDVMWRWLEPRSS
jgi:hypothetical protein